MSAAGHDLAVDDTRDVEDIEDAFVAHRSLFGRWPGARLVDEIGVLRFETPLLKLPYNGVIRTAIAERADQVVAGVIDRYARPAPTSSGSTIPPRGLTTWVTCSRRTA